MFTILFGFAVGVAVGHYVSLIAVKAFIISEIAVLRADVAKLKGTPAANTAPPIVGAKY